jgi:hypothetical protein
MAKPAWWKQVFTWIRGNALWSGIQWLYENAGKVSTWLILVGTVLANRYRQATNSWQQLNWIDQLMIVIMVILLAGGAVLFVAFVVRTGRERRNRQNRPERSNFETFHFKGQTRYRCPHCEFDHYDQNQLVKHIRLSHGFIAQAVMETNTRSLSE